MRYYVNKGPGKMLDPSRIRWAGDIELFGEEFQGRGIAVCVDGHISIEDSVYSYCGKAIPQEYSAICTKLDLMVIADMMKRQG